jgi:hypothetical protein
MSGFNDVFIYVDTMVFLHFVPLEHIDWTKLAGSQTVTIVVSRVIIRELDTHKNSHPSQKVRERARKALQRIEQWAAVPTEIRPGVIVSISQDLPSGDLKGLKINPDWPDDLQLAIALEHAQSAPEARILVASDDTGARIHARNLGLDVLPLDDALRIPSEKDPLEAENAVLRSRLLKLQAAVPHLKLAFSSGSNLLKFAVEDLHSESTAWIQAELEKRKKDYPPYSSKNLDRALMGLHFPSDSEITRYNTQLNNYYGAVERWLQAVVEHRSRSGLTFEIRLTLFNEGGAPGDDIDISLHFPDGFLLVEGEDLEPEPEEPDPPRPPRNLFEIQADHFSLITPRLHHLYRSDFPTFQPPGNASSPRIEKTESYDVSYTVRRLKHGQTEELDPVFVIFEDYSALQSFRITYSVNAANMPEDTSGALDVVFERPQ